MYVTAKASLALALGAFIMAVAGWTSAARAQAYTITDLGTPGNPCLYGPAVNNAGQVAGETVTETGSEHAFLYRSGTRKDIGTFGGANSRAYGISSDGEVVGYSEMPGGSDRHAFLYHDGAMNDLHTLGGSESEGVAVNSAGQVTGDSLLPPPGSKRHAFFFNNDLGMIDLGTLGGPESVGCAINSVGQIAGYSETPGGADHAFFYSDAMKDLGTLAGRAGSSYGYAINDSGQVAGASDTPAGVRHAFLSRNGVMRDLGTLGGKSSSARGINNAGQVVGGADTSNAKDGEHAFLAVVGPDGAVTMTDLNGLISPGSGWRLTEARCISDTGYITGLGVIGGKQRAFLLTPAAAKKP